MKKTIFLLLATFLCTMYAGAASTRIYCHNDHSWWIVDGATVGAYCYGDGGNNANYPGVRMTPVDGETNLWYVDVDTDKYNTIIFTRVNGEGDGVSDWGAKTGDLSIPTEGGKVYFITQTEAAWDGNICAGEWLTYPFEDHTVYYVNTNDWDAVNIHHWIHANNSTAWPGVAMAKTSDTYNDHTIYSATLPGHHPYCIFNNGNGNQTGNAYFNPATPYYLEGNWYASIDDMPKEDVYILKGDAPLGLNWTVDNTENQMQKQADDSYVLTKNDITLAAGTYYYKVIKNYSWEWSVPQGGDVSNQLVIDKSGKYDITYTLNSELTTLTATPELKEEVAIIATIKMHGNFFGDWNDTEAFAKSADEKTATLTLDLTAGNYNFGVRVGDGNWTANDAVFTRDNNSAVITNVADKSITLQADATGAYTFTWTYENNNLTITYPNKADFSNQPDKLYFHPSEAWKNADNANPKFYAYFYYGNNSEWKELTQSSIEGVLEVENPKTYENVIFCRVNPVGTDANMWNNVWNQSADIAIPNYDGGTLNTCYAFYKNDWSTEGTWVVPTPLTDSNYETILSTYNGKKVNIVVERQFLYDTNLSNEQWFTICLPFCCFNVSQFGNVYQISTIKSNEIGSEMEITANKCTRINPGEPYLILPPAGNDHVILEEIDIPNTVSPSNKVASGAGITVTMIPALKTNGTTGSYYWIGDYGYLYNDNVQLLGLRAYFIIPTTSTGMPPRFRVVAGENQTTDIEHTTINTVETIKAIENGQLFIIRNGVKYNVQGQTIK